MSSRSLAILALTTLALLLTAGCSEDDPVIDMTLDEAWPNEEGRWWRYDLRVSHSETELPNLTDPDGPLPSLRELRTLMMGVSHEGQVEIHDRELNAAFDGDVVTQSGATGQNLVVTSTAAPAGSPVVHTAETFLASLRRARPDLSDRLPAAGKDFEDRTPFGLSGPCWEKTETYIGGYGDLDTELSWLYLETPLEKGATFEMQLVPQLADNVWLRAWIVYQGEWSQEGTTYPRAMEVFTLIDMGIQSVTDEGGTIIGEIRSFACYRTIYAPGVGPVYVHEWRVLAPDPVLQDEDGGLIELEAVLVDTGLPEDPH